MKDYIKSKEVIYKKHNVNSLFDKAIKINPKRRSDDITSKANLLLLNKTNSNKETAGDSGINRIHHKSSLAIPKQKKICIKFKDLIVDSVKNEKLQKSKSISKVILGSNEKENITIKKIKKTFCCF